MRRTWVGVGYAVLLTLTACQARDEARPKPPPANEAATAGRTDLIPCEIIGRRRVARQDCDLANATDHDVREGLAAFNWPKEMRRGRAVLLRLAVEQAPPPPSPEPPAPVKKPIEKAAARPGRPHAAHVAEPEPEPPPPPPPPGPEAAVQQLPGEATPYKPLVGRYMSATLTGDAFEIVPQGPEHQEVLKDSLTHWDWLVTPKSGGDHELTVTTQVEFKDSDGNYVPLRFRPETHGIKVQSPWWLWVWDVVLQSPAWFKALAAAVVALTGLVVALAGLRRAIRGKSPADTPAGP